MKKRLRFVHNRRVLSYILAVQLFITGILCIVITKVIRDALPYMAIGLLGLLAADSLYVALGDREYTHDDARDIANCLVYFGLAFVIFYMRKTPDYIVGAAWGMIGLFTNAEKLAPVIHSLVNGSKHIGKDLFHLLLYCFGIVINLILLTDPEEHLSFHVFILGIELILFAIKFLRDEKTAEEKIEAGDR